MKKALEKLWNEYFAEECAVIDTEEERASIKRAVMLREKANEAITDEQNGIVEEYIEALQEANTYFSKKAFFRGCEFTASFFLETLGSEKTQH